jgi:predicted nucleic acid-binding protein
VIVLDASAAVARLLRLPLTGAVDVWPGRTEQTLHAPHVLDIDRYPHTDLLPMGWDLRANFTTYDAAYVALAVALRAPLLTTDAKPAAAPLPGMRVELID